MALETIFEGVTRAVFHSAPEAVRRMYGGGINDAACLEVGGQRYFVKINQDAPRGFFAAEADGLARLRRAGELRVPGVIAHADAADGRPAYLVLEWLEESAPSPTFAERFGAALPALHSHTADTFGLERDNFIGSLPQRNTPNARWPDFFRDLRLRPQIDRARQRGLSTARLRLLDRLLERIESLIPSAVPSLLHGDLWRGNYLILADDTPALIDPSVYYGDREMELAFTELFSGFPSVFYRAYHAAYPLDPGYRERRALYQLYPLLVHYNLFGEPYGGHVESICQRDVG